MNLLSDFEYPLPEHLIAQKPLENRRDSRLLVLRKQIEPCHRSFADVVDYLQAGDALVVNDSTVMKARLRGRRIPTGGQVEILLSRMLEPNLWVALVRATGKKENMHVSLGMGSAIIKGPSIDEPGAFIVEINGDLHEIIATCGELPLPHYIDRPTTKEDESRYQTVYAKGEERSVAAPTAGLHFDEVLLSAIRQKGVTIVPVTLHVGAGTFVPVRHEDISQHRMHAECAEISEDAARQINEIKARGGRVVAVGTTATRTLESAVDEQGKIKSGAILTRLFIRPGYRFKLVDALITNFHLPKTTLFMLVCAAVGRERALNAYLEAIAHNYRFFSYGDACYFELEKHT